MSTETEIKSAITRSISHSHTETVHVEVDDLEAAYMVVSVEADDCDRNTEDDGSVDVWGSCDGDDFRLRLRKTPPKRGRGQPKKEPTTQIRAYAADVPRLAKHGTTQAEAVRALLTKRQPGNGVASPMA